MIQQTNHLDERIIDIEQEKKRVSRLQIPNELIISKDITSKTFWLYVQLKHACVKINKVNIHCNTLLHNLRWKDKRTLKKHLKLLAELGYITMESEKISVYEPIKLTITQFKKNFTQVDVESINKVWLHTKSVITKKINGKMTENNLSEHAARLYFFYEKNYNINYRKAFPSYRTIEEEIGIGKSYISAINTVFNEYGLVTVHVGQWINDINKKGTNLPRRMNNSYIPHCNRASNKKEELNIGKKYDMGY